MLARTCARLAQVAIESGSSLMAASVGLRAGGADHLAPFVNFGMLEPAEFRRCAAHHVESQIGERLLRLGIPQDALCLCRETIDDVLGRFGGSEEPDPGERL